MIADDLREYIAQAEAMGQLQRVSGAHWDLEIGALTELLAGQKALLFDAIPGYPEQFRVFTNPIHTWPLAKAAAGVPESVQHKLDAARSLKDKLKTFEPLPCAEVESGPILEHVQQGEAVDAWSFPTPRWHELDGGRFIGTGVSVITRDPDDGWINAGVYRVQVHEKDVVSCFMSPGRHGLIHCMKYWERGQNAPVALVCGHGPALLMAAANGLPTGVSEYGFAGWLRGQPIEVVRAPATGLPVPASAELVLEGEIPPPWVEKRWDGPFGEWRGYYDFDHPTPRPDVPVVHVKSISYRDDPILLGSPPLRPPLDGWYNLLHSAFLWHDLEHALGVPEVRGAWMLESGGNFLVSVISIKQRYGGHAMHAAMAANASRTGAYHQRYTIVVDDDIDPTDLGEVLWAVATRCDPKEQTTILPDTWFAPGDNLLGPEQRAARDFTHSRMILNACRPYYWKDKFPPVNRLSTELKAQIEEKWRDVLFQC
ncbi:MAG: UbiD family decarboxylase [Chloroflexi bacterium]|nr:UbiD family decarboxylase [Chloroflexota bacterium]